MVSLLYYKNNYSKEILQYVTEIYLIEIKYPLNFYILYRESEDICI